MDLSTPALVVALYSWKFIRAADERAAPELNVIGLPVAAKPITDVLSRWNMPLRQELKSKQSHLSSIFLILDKQKNPRFLKNR